MLRTLNGLLKSVGGKRDDKHKLWLIHCISGFFKNKKLLTQGNHFGFTATAQRPPPHLCLVKRGCRKHNTNGSGITLNIQMGKLIVYAWIHHCDYLAPLALLLSSLKATQSAFCFHLVPLKSLDHTIRLYHWSSRYKFIPINVISFVLTTCDYCAKCKPASFLWQTPSMRSVSRMTKNKDDLPPNSWCKWAKFQWLLHQCCHSVCVLLCVQSSLSFVFYNTWKHKTAYYSCQSRLTHFGLFLMFLLT